MNPTLRLALVSFFLTFLAVTFVRVMCGCVTAQPKEDPPPQIIQVELCSSCTEVCQEVSAQGNGAVICQTDCISIPCSETLQGRAANETKEEVVPESACDSEIACGGEASCGGSI